MLIIVMMSKERLASLWDEQNGGGGKRELMCGN